MDIFRSILHMKSDKPCGFQPHRLRYPVPLRELGEGGSSVATADPPQPNSQYGREKGLELREDVHTVLQPGHVVSMEPMLTIPVGMPGLEEAAGGYREHDILVVHEDGAENITGYPYGPDANVVV